MRNYVLQFLCNEIIQLMVYLHLGSPRWPAHSSESSFHLNLNVKHFTVWKQASLNMIWSEGSFFSLPVMNSKNLELREYYLYTVPL